MYNAQVSNPTVFEQVTCDWSHQDQCDLSTLPVALSCRAGAVEYSVSAPACLAEDLLRMLLEKGAAPEGLDTKG